MAQEAAPAVEAEPVNPHTAGKETGEKDDQKQFRA